MTLPRRIHRQIADALPAWRPPRTAAPDWWTPAAAAQLHDAEAEDAAREAAYHATAEANVRAGRVPVSDACPPHPLAGSDDFTPTIRSHPLGRFPELWSQEEMDDDGRTSWWILPGILIGTLLIGCGLWWLS